MVDNLHVYKLAFSTSVMDNFHPINSLKTLETLITK